MSSFRWFNIVSALALSSLGISQTAKHGQDMVFNTDYARFQLRQDGRLQSIHPVKLGHEYLAKGKASPILSLQDGGKVVGPLKATFNKSQHRLTLTYPKGTVATVSVIEKGSYVRLKLMSLTNRGSVDNIVWGPIHMTISKTIGDMIGVVRDGEWAIGMLALNDNTTEGQPFPGDLGQMYYYIHSPDPAKYPVPPQYKEGQRFSIGGDGHSDVAFYSHPEEYFHMGFQGGALLEPGSGSVIAYHSRDRRKSQSIFYTLIPGLPPTQPRHQIVDAVDADFIGSSVALYACPDDQGRSVIQDVVKKEGLLNLQVDGKWAKDPAAFKPDIAWFGPHDKLIEYANALGLKSVQDEGMGEYYMDPTHPWDGQRVGFADKHRLTIREFTDQTRKHGIKFGLHTLCMFVQTGSGDVHPIPNEHFQTVLRTHLASDLSADGTQITVTDPSFLAEKGTWHDNDMNVLRIGTELLSYDGISQTGPWTLTGVKRAQYGTQASTHSAGDELVKLQITCYQGFIPDMKLMLQYADLYAERMVSMGMEYVDFDGLESCMYQNHGDFAFKTFFHRLFDTYHRLSGGKYPRVMGSCVCEGNWHYMSVCNVGGGNNMFDPVANKWGIEGKDVRYQFESNYFPATFGIQDYHGDWTPFDAENLEAKSVGWNANYMLGLSQDTVEKSGEKSAIFKALRTWQDARTDGVFTNAIKEKLKDLNYKFHLERAGKSRYLLSPVLEKATSMPADGQLYSFRLNNLFKSQSLNFAAQFVGDKSATINGFDLVLPGRRAFHSDRKMKSGEFIICKGNALMIADASRRQIALLASVPETLPSGRSAVVMETIGASDPSHSKFQLRVWSLGTAVKLGR